MTHFFWLIGTSSSDFGIIEFDGWELGRVYTPPTEEGERNTYYYVYLTDKNEIYIREDRWMKELEEINPYDCWYSTFHKFDNIEAASNSDLRFVLKHLRII